MLGYCKCKRTSYDGRDITSVGSLYPDLVAYMQEYILMAHRHECQLTPVGVCSKIF